MADRPPQQPERGPTLARHLPAGKGGTEAAVHAVRLALCQLSPLSLEHPEQLEAGQPEQHHFNLAIATDVSNAFGEIHRAPIFRVIKEEMPELFEVARLFYGQDTHLWFELDTPAEECELPDSVVNGSDSDFDLGDKAREALSEISRSAYS